MRLWTPFTLSLTVCVSTLIAAEWLSSLLLPGLNWPHFSNSPRNPHHLRGWAEYTDPARRPPDVPLVVVITNSQGLYMEGEEQDLAWPHQLQNGLREFTGEPWQVANFSMARNKGVELALFAARAAQLHPDVVMVVAGYENFTNRIEDVSDSPSDVNRLVWDPELRTHLSPAFLARFAPFHMGSWLDSYSSLLHLTRRLFELRPHVWYWIVDDTLWAERWKTPPDWDEGASLLLQEIESQVHREGSAQLLMVDMPRCEDRWNDQGRAKMAGFGQRVAQVLGHAPHTRFIDASGIIPCEQFYRRSLHFVPRAHQSFAEFLLPRVVTLPSGE